ncbi:MFS transporter [Streptomyces sp. NPDC059063]|uniref:MFS transporter n=1 Tax=unclassified Streptomyces TaxID=2593676 RepID=UPI0036BF6218
MRKIWLLMLGSFTLGLDAYVMAGLLPVVADDLGTTVSLAGQMVTVFTLAYAVSAPLVTGLFASARPRVLIIAALGVFTLGNALTALAPGLAVLLVARAVAGVGAGVYSALSTAAAAALAGPEKRGRALALVMGGMSSGTVLGVPLGVLLADHTSWRSTMWLVTGLGAVALAGLAVGLPEIPAQPPVPVRARLGALTDRAVLPIVGVSFLGAVSSLGLYTYLAPVLDATGGVGEGDVAPYLWAWGIGGVLGSVLAGPLVDRTGRVLALVTGVTTLLVVSEASLPLLGAVAFPALVIWGAAGWAFQVPQQHRLLALSAERGTVALALNNSALYLGSAVGSGVAGLALSAGLDAGALPWAAAAVAGLGLAVHLATARGRRTGPGTADEGDSRCQDAPGVSTLGTYEHS